MAEATPPDTGGELETVTSVDGTEIAFERTGSGPPLVLVAGGGANDHTRWELAGVRPTFAEHCTVYAIDGRGLGASGDADEYELEREFEDVAAVVESINEPAVLLGHSSGALIALEAALRTDNLRKLVLYEPPIPVSNHYPDVGDAVAKMEALMDEGQHEQVLILFLREVANIPPDEIDALREAPNWRSRVDGAFTIPRAIRGISEYEFDAARFTDMTTPTLLLAGSESQPFTHAATEALDKALPNPQIVTFEGHGHDLPAPDAQGRRR
ncbi:MULTISPECIES: alpha/beta fold hydrolase [Halorussus]|uniref:alpha/beta fold hydrolase n=1 Tax=Halorussus TaxID=1070314 RepID=UPI00209DDE9D|nr:alpha/beta hydrolase [Halorussus vallis]USZ75122.1 alpha/beta hydrolase [Halorussus vallis]